MVNNQAGVADNAAEIVAGRSAAEGGEARRAPAQARRMDSMARKRKWL